MPLTPPGRCLSAKFLKLGRLRSRSNTPEDTTTPPEKEREFRIVHTPDRLAPDRPVPTEEECRREIKKWHSAADKERLGLDELVITQEALQETRSHPRLNRIDGDEGLRNKYDFRESDEDDTAGKDRLHDNGRKNKGKEVDRLSVKGSTGRRIIDPVVFDLEEDEKTKTRREREEDTNRRLIREMGGLESPPIFSPPRPHREVGDQRWITGRYEKPREAPRPGVRLTPPGAAFAKPVAGRGADLELMNDLSGDEGGGPGDGEEIDLDWLIKMELYKRGVCPVCRNMRSNIEVFRCGRCGSDLVGYIGSGGKPREKGEMKAGISQTRGPSKALPLPISRFITTSLDPTEMFRGPGPAPASAPTSRHRTPVPMETKSSKTPPPRPLKSSLRRRRDQDISPVEPSGTPITPTTPNGGPGEEIGNLRVRFADLYDERDSGREPRSTATPKRPQGSRSPISGFHEDQTEEQRAGLVRMNSARGREAEILMEIYDSYYS